jgi:hypothetical protein
MPIFNKEKSISSLLYFLDCACKRYGNVELIIIFDDIDTSLDKGIIILEVLRKYLTTPKIIAVLLGDIELYSTLVRQMQWKKIDPNKVLQEYEFDKNKEKYDRSTNTVTKCTYDNFFSKFSILK